jgi:tRNA pseudouridine38-40 synthase
LRRLRLVLQYDGTDFCGFQRQPNGPTVQEALEARLSQICGHPVTVVGAGRTDAGVHALGQVVHFDTTGRIPVDRVARAANSFPGSELVVRQVEETTSEFHARFSAVRRTYHYYFSREKPSPFLARYVVHTPTLPPEAAERMREALPALIGRHDFASFRTGGGEAHSTVRTVFHARLVEWGSLLRLEVAADGFLRGMVRAVAGFLMEIGRGRRKPGALAAALASPGRTSAVVTAPTHGLFLVSVEYPDGFPDAALPEEAIRSVEGGVEELRSLTGEAGGSR